MDEFDKSFYDFMRASSINSLDDSFEACIDSLTRLYAKQFKFLSLKDCEDPTPFELLTDREKIDSLLEEMMTVEMRVTGESYPVRPPSRLRKGQTIVSWESICDYWHDLLLSIRMTDDYALRDEYDRKLELLKQISMCMFGKEPHDISLQGVKNG